jgi:hypothetical protein
VTGKADNGNGETKRPGKTIPVQAVNFEINHKFVQIHIHKVLVLVDQQFSLKTLWGMPQSVLVVHLYLPNMAHSYFSEIGALVITDYKEVP